MYCKIIEKVSDVTIWHHNSSTIPQTEEQGMVVKYLGESSNICIHRVMCLNHKHLTCNKANINLWCWAIWVFMDLKQIYWPWLCLSQYCCLISITFHIVLITVPYLCNIVTYVMLPFLGYGFWNVILAQVVYLIHISHENRTKEIHGWLLSS